MVDFAGSHVVVTGGTGALGRAVIGGLMFATFATLFFVPCVFSIIHGRRERKRASGEELATV